MSVWVLISGQSESNVAVAICGEQLPHFLVTDPRLNIDARRLLAITDPCSFWYARR